MAGHIDRAKQTGRGEEAFGQDLQRKVFREEFRHGNALDDRSKTKGKQPALYNFSIY